MLCGRHGRRRMTLLDVVQGSSALFARTCARPECGGQAAGKLYASVAAMLWMSAVVMGRLAVMRLASALA